MQSDPLALAIQRAQTGDPTGFDWLVDNYGRRVYGFVYRLTGNRTDAEDLFQEVMLRLVRRIGSYEHTGRFEPWLFRIAANLVRDRARRAETRKVVGTGQSAEENDDILAQEADPRTVDPDFGLRMSEQIDELQEGLSRLPDIEREVLMMRHFSEMTFKEIAAATGAPLGTTLARAHRALRKLRQWMDPQGCQATGS